MAFKSDIEIAQEAKMLPIVEVAKKLKIKEEDIELYGRYKAKLSMPLIRRLEKEGKPGKLVLVTAITPTPAGEGKSTTTVGLAQGLAKINKDVIVALREPSLGPCMGVKGGAAGGGYSQVVPMEDINLHFTGDFHAITSAHMLLSAMVDNHVQQGNKLNIDPRRIVWKRVVDMNDRELRQIVVGLGGKAHGVPRQDGFDITVASEVMAILCLSKDLHDLKERLSKIIVAYDYEGKPVTAGQIKAQGAMAALLKDAIKPNLVQTIENVPAIIHGGPFANIAHGCNSVVATKTAMRLADYTITEAGFGADLGAEKFFDIKCRKAGLAPSAVVLVATVRALADGELDASEFHFAADGTSFTNVTFETGAIWTVGATQLAVPGTLTFGEMIRIAESSRPAYAPVLATAGEALVGDPEVVKAGRRTVECVFDAAKREVIQTFRGMMLLLR